MPNCFFDCPHNKTFQKTKFQKKKKKNIFEQFHKIDLHNYQNIISTPPPSIYNYKMSDTRELLQRFCERHRLLAIQEKIKHQMSQPDPTWRHSSVPPPIPKPVVCNKKCLLTECGVGCRYNKLRRFLQEKEKEEMSQPICEICGRGCVCAEIANLRAFQQRTLEKKVFIQAPEPVVRKKM